MSKPTDMAYGPPEVSELVTALREFLADEVVPATDEPLRYHVRVAVGVLAQIGRELELGSAHADAHRRRLHMFGANDDRELAFAIRNGDLDSRFSELVAALRDDVAEKVAVSNPTALVAENHL